MKKNINVKKLNRIISRGEDSMALRDGAQERFQTLFAKNKHLRATINDAAPREYRSSVAALPLAELQALSIEQQVACRIDMAKVLTLVDGVAREAGARQKIIEMTAECNAQWDLINSLKQYAGVSQ